MIPNEKRTAQACRMYDALLRYYPISFQREYGDTLALQFRDEYREVLASENKLSLFRFWIFIFFDFVCSLVREVLEEGVKMIRKNFFVICAIAAGLATLLQVLLSFPNIFTYGKLELWLQYLFYPLYVGCGALTLLGIAKVSESQLIFRILPLLLVASVAVLLPIPYNDPGHGWVPRYVIEFLLGNAESVVGYYFYGYYLLIGIICIAALAKKKWLPGVCFLVFISQGLVPMILHWLSIDSPLLTKIIWEWDWYREFSIVQFAVIWFMVAWWLYKENKEKPVEGALEVAG